ncbi:hypothetical protein Q8F55_001708 [Vanrija albida]|uniref:NADAR domain-containing protein n=1 Tax=Vanrija albida TaxID=181172 RepID=A0ABR3Q7X4_9TREE
MPAETRSKRGTTAHNPAPQPARKRARSARPAAPAPAPVHPPAAPAHPDAAYTLFYGWASGPLAPLSQWYPAPFVDPSYPGNTFLTAEHYMMFRKALLFAPEQAGAVVAAQTPKEAKAIGRGLPNFDRGRWDEVADGVVERASYLKFSQREELWEVLRATRGVLVEASPRDRIWGIGFGKGRALENRDRWGTNREEDGGGDKGEEAGKVDKADEEGKDGDKDEDKTEETDPTP